MWSFEAQGKPFEAQGKPFEAPFYAQGKQGKHGKHGKHGILWLNTAVEKSKHAPLLRRG